MLNSTTIRYADALMRMHPDPDWFSDRHWGYPQGFILNGFIQAWERTGHARFRDYVLAYVDKHTEPDGRTIGFVGNSLDDILAGSLFIWAFQETGNPRYKTAADHVRKAFDTYPRVEDGTFWHADWCPREVWIDGLFMGQLFLSKYAALPGNEADFDECARQLEQVHAHCRKPGTGLFLHAWSSDGMAPWADPKTGCSPEVWSEGLGWVAMALVETLSAFPKHHPRCAALEQIWRELAEDLLRTQDAETGLWHQVVDRGERSDNWHDTSGSAMFTFSLAHGLELGLLEGERVKSAVQRGYRGICSKVDFLDNGSVVLRDTCEGLGVQMGYEEYIRFPKTDNAQEAVGAFLWAVNIAEHPVGQTPAKGENHVYT